MKVSVIIPTYNAEKYLTETLESVLNQTINDYEVITVNDGSKDNSLSILREYESKYDNLVVIDKENGGPSAARNAGLEIAKGDFIFFFDSDDILELDALQEMYERAVSKRADLVIAGYDIFDNYTVTPINGINDLIAADKIEKYDELILQTFSMSNKLFRKSVIDKNNLRLPPISYSEDGVFTMSFVYNASKIVGLDKVVFHYRRLNGEGNAITETISDSKVKDYIAAHKMIVKLAKESILKDYPKYKTFKEVRKENVELAEYVNKIIYKELNILLRQFYAKFWSLEDETVNAIVAEVEDKLEMLDIKNVSLIADDNPDITIYNLCRDKKEMVKRAVFTTVLYGDEENRDAFIKCVNNLAVQNFIAIKIVVPQKMKEALEEAGMLYENIVFEDVDSENELFHAALEKANTRYIVFCDAKVLYANNAFKYIFKRFIKSNKDFLVELIYHTNFGEAQPVYINRIAQQSLDSGMEYNEKLCMDYTLANKFFTVEYLKKCKIDRNATMLSHFEQFYKTGCYAFQNDGIVIYDDTEESFVSYVATEETRKYIEDYMKDEVVDLNSEDIKTNPSEAFVKLQEIIPKNINDFLLKKAINKYSKLKVENQVLFVSIRKDGELEGNAKALYPHIKGNKVICAKKLPHNPLSMMKMVKLVATSKVIVTDDYLKYIRYFTLKPGQRVVQLWHACGAFKKFGQRGTNLTIRTDNATHAQYNLMCVSGESVRPIYADAFNINLKKVKALGCPRSDDFFNEELIAEKRKMIYDKYPELKDKFIIIYAPTFRDIGQGRDEFNPQIDFDRLSANLLPNQEFIICPHPVMKNSIIPKKYPNIRVMRDFSTNDLMFVSDMLITDYSSVIFEYALLKKPIAFFCYDLATYNRGFYLKYPEDLPGDVYENQEELEEYLANPAKHELTEKHDLFVKKYMTACDGQSCRRIADMINSYMEER